MRKLILLFLFFLPLFSHSQSYIHYIGPVHSKQSQTLYAREQMLYITSPYEEGDVYVKITSYDGTEFFTLSPNGSVAYTIGNNGNSKLIIATDELGENLDDKGYKVEAFKDNAYTDPVSIFAELRVQAGNQSGNQRMQSNSSFIKGNLAPGKSFRLGHGKFDRFDQHRRVFVTFMAVESGTTNVLISDLREGWDHILGTESEYEIDADGNYTFSFNENQTHALALELDNGSPPQNSDALIGALVTSNKDIVVNVGYWGGANAWAGQGRDIGFDQIKPSGNISNEYIFLPAAGNHNIGGNVESTPEYAILVAAESNTKIWLHTNLYDTASVAADYTLNAGEYQIVYFEKYENKHIYVLSNKRFYGYQNMGGDDSGPQAAAMMLISGINPLASSKINGIYNIEDIAGVNFEMQIKILTKTNPVMTLNGLDYSSLVTESGVIAGREDFSYYRFNSSAISNILSAGSARRLNIESNGPVYGMYYGYNGVQGIAGYFFAFSDFDLDGISDSDDFDDDNDGIYDEWEGDVDTDGDGLVNRLDLDSDNDGCFDAIEAGYTDPDDNGILGIGTTDSVIVNSLGVVIANSDGTAVSDGYTLPLDTDNNGIYDFRQPGKQIEITKHPDDVIMVEVCPDYVDNPPFFNVIADSYYVNYIWQISYDSGGTWQKIRDVENFSGYNEDTLKIISAISSLNGALFRAIVEDKAFICGVPDTSNVAKITLLPDNDLDCIADDVDLDDDNDGIYDTEEDTTDIDDDGIINSFDLDSDGDDCFDVIEAGFVDEDGDGLLGNSPVTVDSLGLVRNFGGYLDPLDGDTSGVKDYREVGSQVEITLQPISKITSPFSEIMLIVGGNSQASIYYTWQVSKDFGGTWEDLVNDTIYSGVNNDTLTIKKLSFDMDSYRYQVVLSTPSYLCGGDLTSDWVFLFIRPDNDRDGIFDENDVDDDNDGIYDTLELTCESNKFIETFGQGDYISTEYTNYVYAGSDVVSDGSYTIAKRSTNWFNNWLEFNDHTGDENGRMFICNAQYEPGKYFYKRKIENLNTNVPYEVSFWLKDLIREFHVDTGLLNTHIPPNITFEVYSLDVDLNPLDLLYQFNTGNVPRDEKWHEYRFNFNNLDNSAIEIILLSNQVGGYGNDFVLDDIEFNAGCYEDIDNDGIINSFDFDTDGDGCTDVIEAGYLDADVDSVLGDSPVVVDVFGRVIGDYGGYDNPNDMDGNGVFDFKEVGEAAKIVINPISASVTELTNASFIVEATPSGLVDFQWQISTDSGVTWVDISDGMLYSGVSTDTLTILGIDLTMNGYMYRVKAFVPSFVCGETVYSNPFTTTVLEDNDKDQIADIDDLDDDNDGILDTDEDTTDIDNDGIPNHFDLDADGDGCNDVTEAGFGDLDDDGILCVSPVVVDSVGRVLCTVGSTCTPFDVDEFNIVADAVYNESDSSFLLTPELGDMKGMVWFKKRVDLTESFSVTADLNFGDLNSSGADGIAFVMQPLSIDQGSSGGGIGYAGITPSVAVEFDTWFNSENTDPFSNDHAAITYNGDVSAHLNSVDLNNIEDGNWHPVKIEWNPNLNTLKVTFDGVVIITHTKDIINEIFGSSPYVYFGFTAATGGSVNNQSVKISESCNVLEGGSISDGYTDPLDGDGNGVKDYKEVGAQVILVSNPTSISVSEELDAFFVASGSIAFGTMVYQWQESTDEGNTWTDLTESDMYVGVDNDTLNVIGVMMSMVGYQYKLVISSPAFACGVDVYSDPAELTVLSDNDKDEIADINDLDDDNDGIYDVDEGDGDIDNDGTKNSFDLDSDGDRCNDVVEAGFTDGDSDGLLGNSPVTVDSLGVVTSGSDGYTDPLDGDDNGVKDYKEIGAQVDLLSNPASMILSEQLNAFFVASGSTTAGTMVYQWQESTDAGTTWTDLVESATYVGVDNDTLKIINVQLEISTYKYRLVISSPAFVCDVDVYSNPAELTVLPDNDKDEIADINDLDDDNDGIYDTEEDTTDIDDDGIINSFDLDSDGDGCNDVLEAGFTDGDSDGLLGNSPVMVDSLGVVTSGSDGYTDPMDGDSNGIRDYRELSDDPVISSHPVSVEIAVYRPVAFIAVASVHGTLSYRWQMNTGSGWINLSDSQTFIGVDNDTLLIDSVTQIMDGTRFRVVIKNTTLICSQEIISNEALLTVLPDNDRDVIPDIEDLDDDNDGILDVDEGSGDIDNDGIKNSFDLDSDGDGCNDVVEAGFTDGDSDGLLGNSPVTVDSLGVVTSGSDGYTDPLDGDGNGVYDYREVGSSLVILSNPLSVSIIETRNAKYSVEVAADGTILYLWQVSIDEGVTWNDISDDSVYSGTTTATLTLTNAPLEFNDYQFRVKISTPAYLCDEDLQSEVALTVLPDNDKDGIADEDDLDDDNDGILDKYEGIGDVDGDGVINSFDLDSDDDGCFDVLESGCYDNDNDGIIGTSPVVVDGLGLVVNDNLIARYDFTNDAQDSSPNAFHGTVSGATLTTDRYGIPLSAYVFDGIDDKITINHDSLLNLGIYERFTISLWVKFDDAFDDDVDKMFINKSEGVGATNKWMYLYSSPVNKDGITFHTQPEDDWITKESYKPNINQWYHFVIQKDGNTYTHYIDGDTVVSVVDSTQILTNTAAVIIGGEEINGGGQWFNGIIDDIVISADYKCHSEPLDLDGSGTYDFLENGGGVTIDSISESKTIVELKNTSYTITASSLSEIVYVWQYSADEGVTWKNVTDTTYFSGFDTKTLTIKNIPLEFSGYLFRVVVSSPSYACETDKTSFQVSLTVLPDNDLDGVADVDDLDDDNDGIFDTTEGSGDVDNDTIINQFDLDADGDGCFDVIEAGFTDGDGDGILGDSPVSVDSLGVVTSGVDGYTDPVDRDGNLTHDFLEYGSKARIIVEPYDIVIVERLDISVIIYADVEQGNTTLFYLWQVSENGGITWEGLSSAAILEIVNADTDYNDKLFRVIVSTPSYICGDDVVSDVFRILVLDDYDVDLVGDIDDVDDDNDGIYDSLECINNASITLTGDVDSTYVSGYPIVASFIGNTGSTNNENPLYKNNVDVSMDFGTGDIYEDCYIVSDLRFDDGIDVLIDGKRILYFNQYHYDVRRGKADGSITKEFNGNGIFVRSGNMWNPWNINSEIQLVIRSGSIKLLSRTKDGAMVDVLPYMDNTVEGWVLDKNFSFSCEDGFNLEIGNSNHSGPSSFYSENRIIAYVCSDLDKDNDLNNRDLDSDDDNCFDVSEAGFVDSDKDGYLDKSPVSVDSVGRVVTSGNGYVIPVDNDGNGVMDFLEKGFVVNILSTPEDYHLIKEGDTFSLSVDLDLIDRFIYQWQRSEDYGLSWTNISDTTIDETTYLGSNTNVLWIYGVELIKDLNVMYRLIISSPAYYCEDDIATEQFEVEVYHRDLFIPSGFSPNGDGVNDTWRIRGIEGYPNNYIRIFNMWGNRVYHKRGYRNEWRGENQLQLYYGDGKLPESTYFYLVDLGDGLKPLTGFVYIKRD